MALISSCQTRNYGRELWLNQLDRIHSIHQPIGYKLVALATAPERHYNSLLNLFVSDKYCC